MKSIIIVTLSCLLLSANAFARTIEEIKMDIVNLAEANMSNKMNRPEIRKQLNILVTELTDKSTPVSLFTWQLHAPGSWQQIWADEADNSPEGAPTQNLEHIYQYVEENGRAVNLGERIFPDGSLKTFALEAIGSVKGNLQTTEILKSFVFDDGIEQGLSLRAMAKDILENKNLLFQEVMLGEFPNGPIGAKSDLKMLFLDRDLKIGTAPNVYTGVVEMFILVRENIID